MIFLQFLRFHLKFSRIFCESGQETYNAHTPMRQLAVHYVDVDEYWAKEMKGMGRGAEEMETRVKCRESRRKPCGRTPLRITRGGVRAGRRESRHGGAALLVSQERQVALERRERMRATKWNVREERANGMTAVEGGVAGERTGMPLVCVAATYSASHLPSRLPPACFSLPSIRPRLFSIRPVSTPDYVQTVANFKQSHCD
jgi:hypothetical protein